MRHWQAVSGMSWGFRGGAGGDVGEGDGGHSHWRGEPGTLVSAGQPEFLPVRLERTASGDPQPLEGGRRSASREGPQLGRGCSHAAALGSGRGVHQSVNTALNALRLEGWFPFRMSMPRGQRPAPSAQSGPSPASPAYPLTLRSPCPGGRDVCQVVAARPGPWGVP